VTGALGAGLLAGYAIAVPVGAIAVYLITLSSRAGFAAGAAAGLGVATVDGVYAAVAVLAGGVVGPSIAAIAGPLRRAAVVVLAALGLRMAWPAVRPAEGVDGRFRAPPDAPAPARAYATLAGLTAVNPATVVYFAALVTAGVVGAAAPGADRAAFIAGAFVASASWQLLVAAGGSLLGRVLAGPAARRVTAAVGGGVVVLLALHLGLSAA
jgi:arginine exporter protein ArgO